MMTMFEWAEFMGNTGEFLGSIAVLATLIYLAVQIREARAESRVSIAEGRAVALRDLYSQLKEERISRISAEINNAFGFPTNSFEAVVMERAGVSREEASAIFAMYAQFLNYTRHQLQILPQLSAMDREIFDLGIYYRWSKNTIGGLFYDAVKGSSDTATTQYIDEILAQHEKYGSVEKLRDGRREV